MKLASHSLGSVFSEPRPHSYRAFSPLRPCPSSSDSFPGGFYPPCWVWVCTELCFVSSEHSWGLGRSEWSLVLICGWGTPCLFCQLSSAWPAVIPGEVSDKGPGEVCFCGPQRAGQLRFVFYLPSEPWCRCCCSCRCGRLARTHSHFGLVEIHCHRFSCGY